MQEIVVGRQGEDEATREAAGGGERLPSSV